MFLHAYFHPLDQETSVQHIDHGHLSSYQWSGSQHHLHHVQNMVENTLQTLSLSDSCEIQLANQKTQRQTEAKAVSIDKPQGRCRH